VDIELTEFMGKPDKALLMEWSEHVFPVEGRKHTWSAPTHHIIARSSGEPIAHLGFGRYEIMNVRQAMQVVGVGGVVVRPQWQGQNIPQRLFACLHSTEVLDARESVCTLFCPARLESYYARQGYQKFTGEVLIPVGERHERIDFSFMCRGNTEFGSPITLLTDPW
jgi:predicted N-acetyltransferase YhbS